MELANESAPVDIAVSSSKALEDLADRIQSSRKRKATTNIEIQEENNPNQRKLSKSYIIMKNEKQELEDESRLKRTYQSSFIGVEHILLENISVSISRGAQSCYTVQEKESQHLSYCSTSASRWYYLGHQQDVPLHKAQHKQAWWDQA